MTSRRNWLSLGLSSVLLLAASPAQAQVAVPGKGWSLDADGSVTSTPGEVISGRNSIKGSRPSLPSSASIVITDTTFIRFTPNQTYTMTLTYRVVGALPASFEFGFSSGMAAAARDFLEQNVINAAAGFSATATVTRTLKQYPDYQARVSFVGTGTIVIDDIRVTDSGGQLVASENAEGPTIAPGPLNFQITDAVALVPEASGKIQSATVKDLDGDSYPETILTMTAPNPSTTPIRPMIIEASARMRLATTDFFPAGAPTPRNAPGIFFADINYDGLQDILFAECGFDGVYVGPPPQSEIGIGLNLGGGKYRNVSFLVPGDLQTTRSCALAVGDIDGDGRVEIVLPDELNGANTALLRWNGNGFDAQRNWIDLALWKPPVNLVHHSWMVVADLDKDGRQDLLVSGAGWPPPTPNLRILFGAPGGFAALVELPDGPWGHTTAPPVTQGADVTPVVLADFNNDGWTDIFATEEQLINYPPGVYTDTNDPNYANIRTNGGTVFADMAFQVLLNQGSRRFADVTSGSTVQNLGRRYYPNLIPADMNNDGFLDVVGLYQTKLYAGVHVQWGTTVFLNDGTGAFQVVDGAQVLAAVTTTPSNGQRWNLGAFAPTVVNPRRTEGIVYESVGGQQGHGESPRNNLYKVVANGAIGTGPDFADSATLGVPGFNEFYYLRHYADAFAAVQRGEYRNGLAHYLAVGQSRGYQSRAPSFASGPTGLTSTIVGSTVTLTWQAPLSGPPTSYVIEAGSSSGAANLAVFDTGSVATSLTVPNVPAGTYFVRVRGRSTSGFSAPSNEIVVTVGGA